MGLEMDPTNPYDPPERQTLEEQLYHDQRLQAADHQAAQAERGVIDAATAAGRSHTHDDERLTAIQSNEASDAAHVVQDQQGIDNWDHAHPGWQDHLDQYQPSADAGAAASDPYASADAGAAGSDPYASGGYGDASGSDPYASADDTAAQG